MTNQEIFDIISKHLLTQNAKSMATGDWSVNGKPACTYRGDGGMKCAIGILIPDEMYSSDIEGKDIYYRRVRTILDDVCGLDTGPTRHVRETLYRSLQACHDSHEVSDWPNQLKIIAEYYDLTFTG